MKREPWWEMFYERYADEVDAVGDAYGAVISDPTAYHFNSKLYGK